MLEIGYSADQATWKEGGTTVITQKRRLNVELGCFKGPKMASWWIENDCAR